MQEINPQVAQELGIKQDMYYLKDIAIELVIESVKRLTTEKNGNCHNDTFLFIFSNDDWENAEDKTLLSFPLLINKNTNGKIILRGCNESILMFNQKEKYIDDDFKNEPCLVLEPNQADFEELIKKTINDLIADFPNFEHIKNCNLNEKMFKSLKELTKWTIGAMPFPFFKDDNNIRIAWNEQGNVVCRFYTKDKVIEKIRGKDFK